MTATTIVHRPLTPAFLRESLYLLATGALGILAFSLAITTLSISLSLLIFVVGIPVAAGCAMAHRYVCDLDRELPQLVSGRRIERRYRPSDDGGVFRRSLTILGDRQTWGDLGWMCFGFWLTMIGLTVVTATWSALGLVTYPLWVWFLPDDATFGLEGGAELLVIAAHVPAGVLLAIGGAWAVRGMARLQVTVADWALGLGRQEQLEQRVAHLTETRADAVDESTAALQRVERDLHDGAQARLVALAMDLGMAEQRLASAEDPDAARELVTEARSNAQAAMVELRELVRGIGPGILRERGLDAALSALASGRATPVEVSVQLPERPPEAIETAAYFVAAEGIANAAKHARASQVAVRVFGDGLRRLIVEVVDDGVGGADPERGSGLSGLRKRVGALDGSLSVTSPAGGPTHLRAEIPLR